MTPTRPASIAPPPAPPETGSPHRRSPAASVHRPVARAAIAPPPAPPNPCRKRHRIPAARVAGGRPHALPHAPPEAGGRSTAAIGLPSGRHHRAARAAGGQPPGRHRPDAAATPSRIYDRNRGSDNQATTGGRASCRHRLSTSDR
ncbi:hypothetical protein ACP4OV_017559 [Aristida adscensionis]